jgi:PAS domain S-box-containing protein
MHTLLYVDDEPDLLELGKLFLEQTGDFDVTTAGSTDEALSLLATRHFDAVVSDYDMPAKSGLVFLKEVRRMFGDLPFILFTGRGREEVVIEAINHRADFYLQKGHDTQPQFSELSHKIRQAIRRKEAEDALRESEERFRDLAELLPQIIFEMDLDFWFTFLNRYALEHTGYTREDVKCGISASAFIPVHEQAMIRESLLRIARGEEIAENEYHIIRKDGTAFPGLLYITAISHNGRFCGYRGSVVDISRIRKAEEELRESREYLYTIFNLVNDAIFIHDADTQRIIDVNETCTRMYGYTREDFLSMDVGDFSAGTPPYTQEDAAVWLRKCKAEGPQLFRWMSRRKDGTLFMTEVNMRYARIGSDERVIVTERDITGRKESES